QAPLRAPRLRGRRRGHARVPHARGRLTEHARHRLAHHAVRRPTIRRTQGATRVTVGKATGQVVRQLLSHCAANPAWMPWLIASTKADRRPTMMAESKAPNRIGA